MISVNDSEVDSASSDGGESIYESGSYASNTDTDTDSEPPVSEVSNQKSMLDHAYRDAIHTTADGKLIGGDSSLNLLESLPPHWPLAKLTLPLKFGVNRLDGLVAGYLMELMATHSDASLCRKQISSFAKTLTVRVATYLAKEIAPYFGLFSIVRLWLLLKRTRSLYYPRSFGFVQCMKSCYMPPHGLTYRLKLNSRDPHRIL